MAYSRYALTLIALAGCAFAKPHSTLAPLYFANAPPHDVLNNSYIVMFHDDVPSPVFSTHLDFLKYASQVYPVRGEDDGHVVAHVYDSVIAKGYSATLSPDVLQMIRRRPEVKYVEQEKITRLSATQANAPWVRTATFRKSCSID